MTLLLTGEDVRRVLSMDACIDALERAFLAFADGGAVNRPRSHTYTDLGGGRHHVLKTMDGAVAALGVHALRVSSDLVHERAGRRDKVPAAPGGRYVGFVLLFDQAGLAPLALVHDGELQRLRVGATSALAARTLARPEPRVAGVVGAGWQAETQVAGLRAVFPGLAEIRVYGPTREKLLAFAGVVGGRPAGSAREAIAGADVVALATNAYEPVLDGRWLQPGQHVGSIQGHELDEATLARADLVVVRSREPATHHFAPGHEPRASSEQKRLLPAQGAGEPAPSLPAGSVEPTPVREVVELGEVLAGRAGRRSTDEITLFTGGGTGASSGLGIQFAAVAHAAYEAARARGIGRDLPTEWFTQKEKP